MRILGLFTLSDVTKERLIFRDINADELARRLSSITDPSTNVGFVTGNKRLHGLVSQNKFRLKTIRRSLFNHFTIKGEIKKKDNVLIVDIEYERSIAMALLPNILLVSIIALILLIANEGYFSLGFTAFLVCIAVIILFFLENKREEELEEVQTMLRNLTAHEN